MKKIDVFTWTPPAPKLNPGEVDRMLENLMMASSVDPSQVSWNQPEVEDCPEIDLMRAILFDAVQCAVRHHDSHLQNQRAEARSAIRWIESAESAYFLSFIPICQRLRINPTWIRRLVRERVRRDRTAEVAEAA